MTLADNATTSLYGKDYYLWLEQGGPTVTGKEISVPLT